ncbi:hypothetical protein SRHO_G00021540 [Serrasalmus rhombeus]
MPERGRPLTLTEPQAQHSEIQVYINHPVQTDRAAPSGSRSSAEPRQSVISSWQDCALTDYFSLLQQREVPLSSEGGKIDRLPGLEIKFLVQNKVLKIPCEDLRELTELHQKSSYS